MLLAINTDTITVIMAGLPATIAAVGAAIVAIKGNKANAVQHTTAINQIEQTKDLLIDHAAKAGTLERRSIDRSTGEPNTNVLSSSEGSTSTS